MDAGFLPNDVTYDGLFESPLFVRDPPACR